MGLGQDLSYAMRSFAKAPVFGVTTVVMLAIGIWPWAPDAPTSCG